MATKPDSLKDMEKALTPLKRELDHFRIKNEPRLAALVIEIVFPLFSVAARGFLAVV
jgi:hypothetical protein